MDKGINETIQQITGRLKSIDGIKAIVLGGSRSTGTANEYSDIDIGIYYDGKTGLDIEALNAIATSLDDEKRTGLITNIGDWGKWINGGGWLFVNKEPTDILFRDLVQVTEVINHCLNGNLTMDYQCGHPFGFANSIYMGEVFYCKVLYERDDSLSKLKNKLNTFPIVYKKAVINKFLWEAEFSCSCGRKSIKRRDIVYATGSLYRCVNSLVQVLFALNNEYILNEKGSLQRLSKFHLVPHNFVTDMEILFEKLNCDNIANAFDLIENYIKNIKTL